MNLTLWVRQICGFLILSSILKNLLAQRRYSPYVRLFMNLLLVLLLAQPLMRIDLERLNGVWYEVSANAGAGDWRQQLAVLAGYDQEIGQVKEVLHEQIEGLVSRKGYKLENILLEYNDDTIQKLEIIVSEMQDYIQIPVIWNDELSYKDKEDELEQYLEEMLKPAADVVLKATIR